MKKFLVMIFLMLISCAGENNLADNQTVSQKTSNENQQNNQLKVGNNQQEIQEDKQQSNPQKQTIDVLFHGDDEADREVKKQFATALIGVLNVICSNKEQIRKLYQEKEIKFIVSTDIRRLAKENDFPLTSVDGSLETDSFYFSRQSLDDGKVEHFIALDKEVFASDLRLIVTVNHESIHARNFLQGTAKEDSIDEEIQTYTENVNDLENLYTKFNIESKSPKAAAELRELILRERNGLKAYQRAKLLKQFAKP